MADKGANKAENQLELILKALAALAVRDKNLSEGAPLLDRLGFDRAVIAEIYDTSPASVRAVLSKAKRAAQKTGPTDRGEGKAGAPEATR